MQYIQIENPLQWIGIIVLVFGTLVAYNLFTDEYEAVVSNRKVIKKRFNFRRLFRLLLNHTGTWILTIKKHKVCRTPAGQKKGKADPLAIKVLVVYTLFFLNPYLILWLFTEAGDILNWFPGLGLILKNLNLWEFGRIVPPKSFDSFPTVLKYVCLTPFYLTSFCWNYEHFFVSLWFNVIYMILGLSALNKVVTEWFSHSERSKLVKRVVLAEKSLPDECQVIQLNRDQVRVDYTGTPADATAFITHKRVLSEGCHSELEVQPDIEFGRVIVTFKSPYRYDHRNWRNEEHKLVKGEKLSFIYIMPNGEKLADSRRVLKAGETTDLDRTLVAYGRGIRNPYYILALPQVDGLTENKLFETLGDYRLPRRPGKEGGEFFVEDDGLYDELDKIIESLPPEIIKSGKCRFSPEILERTQT